MNIYMLCAISFIFLLSIVSSMEAGSISFQHAILYGAYGLYVFGQASKHLWNQADYNDTKKRSH